VVRDVLARAAIDGAESVGEVLDQLEAASPRAPGEDRGSDLPTISRVEAQRDFDQRQELLAGRPERDAAGFTDTACGPRVCD
jgi:hypothetical protein